MENIKNLMGSAYHEGVTLEEVNSFLAGKNMVNLKDGGYVAKDKFDRVENEKKDIQGKYDTLVEQTKDYETLKKENDDFKAAKSNAELEEKLVSLGMSKKAFKYVKGDIDAKELDISSTDEKVVKANVEKYLKDHPEFAEGAKPTTIFRKVEVGTGAGGGQQVHVDEKAAQAQRNAVVNNNLREALGLNEDK